MKYRESIPQEIHSELTSFKNFQSKMKKKDNCLLCSYVKLELKKNERIIFKNDSFICLGKN
jgi:galactose-1-phosphate uridylyltransferase